MDPFTERMVERTRARREKLNKLLVNVGQPCGTRRTPLHENNPPISEGMVKAAEHHGSPSSKDTRRSFKKKSPMKQFTPPPPHNVQDSEPESDEERSEESKSPHENQFKQKEEDSNSSITHGVRSQLKRLGALYSDSEQLSSPIHRTENNFSVEPVPQRSRHKSAMRSARLAALASSINQWEDDLSHPTITGAVLKDKTSLPSKLVSRYSLVGVKRKSSDKIKTEVDNSNVSHVPSPRLPGLKAVRKSGGCSNSAFEVTASPRQLQWDKALLDSLEAQGFCRSDSNSHLIYDFEQENVSFCAESESHEEEEEESPSKKNVGSPIKSSNVGSPIKSSCIGSPVRSPLVMGVAQLRKNVSPLKQASSSSPIRTTTSPVKTCSRTPVKTVSATDIPLPEGSVLQRAAKYESEAASPPKRLARDPAELPLAERMALFEKNKGPLLVPKVPFSTPMPAKLLKESGKGVSNVRPSANTKETKSPMKTPSKTPVEAEESAVLRRLRQFETGNVCVDDSPSRPQNLAVAERQKDLEMLADRWTHNKKISQDVSATPPPPPLPPPIPNAPHCETSKKPTDSPTWRSPRRPASKDNYPGVSEVKRIKVSPPKPGHLYPSLSDMEATTETDVSSANQSVEDDDSSIDFGTADDSFGKDILEAAERVQSSYYSATDSKEDTSITESAVLRDMDEFLEDALGESSDEERSPTPPKKTRGSPSKKSDSFYYKPAPSPEPEILERKSPRRTSTKYRAPQPPSITQSEDHSAPLMHSVSFYRKQQNMTPKSPVRQIQYESTPNGSFVSQDNLTEEESRLVEVKVRQLLDDVSKQQTVISQASQALNLCIATVEFACSAEQVEAERLLLHATHKRQAALNEIQRLKVEGTLRPQNPGSTEPSNLKEHGTLIIKDIALPVKPDFVRSLATDDNNHHFVCLAKCQDIVLATSVSSIGNARDLKDVAVRFSSSLTLNDLPTSFRVTLEVYTFMCRKEMLPHDIKYHINKKESSKRMTPRKQKQESQLARRPVQSPAGPSAVRTSQFNLVGYVIFSLKEIQRTTFTLNKVPFSSPLQGCIQFHVDCNLSLDIEHRGFLSMYDVVSGFGAWHRRWCLLRGDMLSYWRYPDHETKGSAAIDSIDLKTCVTENVGPVSRDLCARPHTFLLETTRPARPADEDSLVLSCKGNTTHVRHLLSADTREERSEWCCKLNRALSVMKAWNKKGE